MIFVLSGLFWGLAFFLFMMHWFTSAVILVNISSRTPSITNLLLLSLKTMFAWAIIPILLFWHILPDLL